MKKIYYEASKCLACKTCEIVCAVGKSASKELFSSISEGTKPLTCVKVKEVQGKNFPIACRHCKAHPCVDACIARALAYDAKKARVIHDKDRCIGCWMCVMVCPYGAIRDNKKLKVPVRCDLCEDEDEPRCINACPVKAIMFLEEDEFEKREKAKKKK